MCRETLIDRHGWARNDAQRSADKIASFVRHGTRMLLDQELVSVESRPIMQYYGFLNLAVAVVLCYRPRNWERYKKHGAEDRTHALNDVELGSKMVKVKGGAISLFHTVVCASELKKRDYSFRELLVGLPFLSAELSSLFGFCVDLITVQQSVQTRGESSKKLHSILSLELERTKPRPYLRRIPKVKIERYLGELMQDFELESSDKFNLQYRSISGWSTSQSVQAKRQHARYVFRALNYGGHEWHSHSGIAGNTFYISVAKRMDLLPTLTSVLLLSFVLASLVRYRPWLANRLVDSKLNVLADVFTAESTAYFVAAIRNLLYVENTWIETADPI